MRKIWTFCFKCVLFALFITQTTFKEGFFAFLHKNDSISIMEGLLQSTSSSDFTPSLTFLVASTNYDMAMYEQSMQRHEEYKEQEKVEIIKTDPPKISIPSTYKSILIYNTHQMEEYADNGNVMSAAVYFMEKLENKGIKVDYISDDFVKRGKELGYGYKQLYSVSRIYLKEALEKKEYDLIIDFHRDALPRESTYITHDGKNYAKLMFSIGVNNDNYQQNYQTASTIYDKMSSQPIPIMKSIYTIRSTYNQDLRNCVVLLEVGSHTNHYQEVLNSLDVLVEVLSSK